MNSNTFFSFSRFYLLLRNDLLINLKKYLFVLFAAFIVLYIALLFFMSEMNYNIEERFYLPFFMMGLAGVGCFIGTGFPELTSKIKTSNYILFPCSVFEKYLVQFLIRFVVCISAFLIIFWIDAHLARLSALRLNSLKEQGVEIASFQYSILFHDFKTLIEKLSFVFAIFSYGTFLFAARLFFKKLALVKTLITTGTLAYLFICCMVVFSHIFFPETKGFDIQLHDYKINDNLTNTEIYMFSITCFSWLFFLPIGYFKLKEKQV